MKNIKNFWKEYNGEILCIIVLIFWLGTFVNNIVLK